jgi:prepilin-type N-terminal cleavage/methylation domain-containing protein
VTTHRRARLARKLDTLRARLREEHGFGLVELMIATTVLSIGIFSVLGSLTSGYLALNRARAASTGSVIADAQTERFRALSFGAICLSNTSTDSTYTAGAPEGTSVPTCSSSDPALVAVRDPVTGPDGRSYRTDTYVFWNCAKGTISVSTPYSTSSPGCLTSGTVVSRPVKLVRVVIRDHTTTATTYASQETTFDQGTGG